MRCTWLKRTAALIVLLCWLIKGRTMSTLQGNSSDWLYQREQQRRLIALGLCGAVRYSEWYFKRWAFSQPVHTAITSSRNNTNTINACRKLLTFIHESHQPHHSEIGWLRWVNGVPAKELTHKNMHAYRIEWLKQLIKDVRSGRIDEHIFADYGPSRGNNEI